MIWLIINQVSFNKVPICFSISGEVYMVYTDSVIRDIDGNGLKDIPFAYYVAFQTSPGNFQCVLTYTQSGPYGTGAYDLNGDGKLDIVYTHWYEGGLVILINNGGFSFTQQRVYSSINSNHLYIMPDKKIIFTDEGNNTRIYDYNTGQFSNLNNCREGLSVADINGDNLLDVVCGASNFIAPGYLKFQLNFGGSWSPTYLVTSTPSA
jgi:hypothetical protein